MRIDKITLPEETIIAVEVDGVPTGTRRIENLRRALGRLLHDLSRRMTLEPGMTILAGTVLGGDESGESSIMLQAGQSMTVDITGIGCLTATIDIDDAPAEVQDEGDGTDP